MSTHTATARAGSNIAFIKYWGVADPTLNIPLNNSISMTLADAYTTTTVTWEPERAGGADHDDHIVLDGAALSGAGAARIVQHLDRLRGLAGVAWRAQVESRNNFPTASGIASSASGFAALTVAGAAALGLSLSPTELSALARLGSGSASRSLFGGFVEWEQGHDHASSVARPLFPAEHWPLCDVVAVVSRHAKAVSSAKGHTMAATSPLNDARVAGLDQALAQVRAAIANRDLDALGPVIERDAVAMHAVMMTGSPALFYWQGGTMEIINAVQRWRADGLTAYFTIDAGPNVHVICLPDAVGEVQARLAALPSVEETIVSGPGPAPQVEPGSTP